MKNPLQSPQNEVIIEFTSSVPFDCELYFWDIVGSIAHVDSLKKAGILSAKEQKSLKSGLKNLLEKIQKGKVELKPELEDIHMNIEVLLEAEIGSLAQKLHTGRSRNDQVALDLRLYGRERILEVLEELFELQNVLESIAEKNLKTAMPGFTHLQPAQPISLAHHMMAYWFKFNRDIDRLLDCYGRLNLCPLGAGALAGNTYGIDRSEVAEALGFDGATENSIDSVSDRDFAAEAVFCLSMVMSHISSMAEEIILWNTPQFGFIKLSDELTTGSSMMPQKRNPDVAELARAKSGVVMGDLISLLSILKGLPMSYNRDLQEDKPSLFDAFDATSDSVWAIRNLLSTSKFDKKRMKDACLSSNLVATDLADYLVGKGIAFRDAYSIMKKMIADSNKANSPVEGWPVSKLKKYHPRFGKDVREFLNPQNAIERREIFGGTAIPSVKVAISLSRKYSKQKKKAIEEIRKDVEGTIARLAS